MLKFIVQWGLITCLKNEYLPSYWCGNPPDFTTTQFLGHDINMCDNEMSYLYNQLENNKKIIIKDIITREECQI